MKTSLDSRFALLLGASAMALTGGVGTAAHAQEGDSAKKLGTVLVTTQKQEQSILDVPIAVSAFDEESLEKLKLAGGPDLVKTIPNVAFTKGNFTGFNFKIRGIGADVIAQSGDAGVGVHQNDVPLNANRLFEAEFYDVERVEVLRGPQGTLYGRNATGGVINIITAKPVLEEFSAKASLTYGNYSTIKGKGHINLPLGDTAAIRLAGSYLERDGFADNLVTGNDIDGRELYSLRASFAWEPTDRLRTLLMVEHFEEDDDRIRSGKQLCTKDPFKTSFQGIAIGAFDQLGTSIGCQDAPLDESRDRVNSAATLGGGLAITAGLLNGDAFTDPVIPDLRTIESAFDPQYSAEQTLITWQGEFDLTENLTVTYLGSYNDSEVLSIEDYNKVAPTIAFNETAGPFAAVPALYSLLFPGGVVSDPQLGDSNLFRTFDLSGGQSETYTHELRLQSDFDGRFNFNLGAIYMDLEAIDPAVNTDGYYVFSNSLTALTQLNNAAGGAFFGGQVPIDTAGTQPSLFNTSLGGDGGNYFRSLSPFELESFAVFGEGYFDLTDDLTLTIGLRYTDDKKSQQNTPTVLFTPEGALQAGGPLQPAVIPGNPNDEAGDGTFNIGFEEVTGRAVLDWSPDLSFTEDTLLFGSYSRGYKGGGINPPQPAGANFFPQFFDPEFIDAFEVGTKNTFNGGGLQVNGTAFYYDYQGYQITQIINRTSANFNIDAELQGLEIETIWNPASTLVLNANLGLLDTEIQETFAIDVLDRTNGRDDLVVLKNAATFANCVVSAQGYATVLAAIQGGLLQPGDTRGLCAGAFVGQEAVFGLDGVTVQYQSATADPSGAGAVLTATAFEPIEGDAKDLSGNSIPNAPEATFNFGAEYTFEAVGGSAWDMRLRGDYYYQADSESRVWNTARDRLDSWDNVNLAINFYNTEHDIEIEFFGKNVTDEEVITGSYLTDDSSGLFTNIFLTEPATYGVSISKLW